VSYTIAANRTTSSRSGSLVAAGKTVSVTQGRATPPAAPSNVQLLGPRKP
jgi:hypothetical protein